MAFTRLKGSPKDVGNLGLTLSLTGTREVQASWPTPLSTPCFKGVLVSQE